MTIIACSTGTHAAYVCNGTTSYLPVEAWDLDGNPLVAGDRGLVDASDYRGLGLFAYLETASAVREAQEANVEPVLSPRPIARGAVVPRLRLAA